MYTVLLPPGVNPIAVNKYMYLYIYLFMMIHSILKTWDGAIT